MPRSVLSRVFAFVVLVAGCESDFRFTDFEYYGDEDPEGFHSPYARGASLEVVTTLVIASSDPTVVEAVYDGATGFRLNALGVGTTEMTVARAGRVKYRQTVEVLDADAVSGHRAIEGGTFGDTLHVLPLPRLRLVVFQHAAGVLLHGYAPDARLAAGAASFLLEPGGAPFFGGSTEIALGSYALRFLAGPANLSAFTLVVHDVADVDHVDYELDESAASRGDTLVVRAIARLVDGTEVVGARASASGGLTVNDLGDGYLYRYDPGEQTTFTFDVGGTPYDVVVNGTPL